jgi:hypothetical protein
VEIALTGPQTAVTVVASEDVLIQGTTGPVALGDGISVQGFSDENPAQLVFIETEAGTGGFGVKGASSLDGTESGLVEGGEHLTITFDTPASEIQLVLDHLMTDNSAEAVSYVAYGYDAAGALEQIGSGVFDALNGTELAAPGSWAFTLELDGVAVLELTALTDTTTFSLESISAALEPATSIEATSTVDDEEAATDVLAISSLDTTALASDDVDTSSDPTVDSELAADLVTDMDSSETSLDGLLGDSTTDETGEVSSLEDTSTTDVSSTADPSMTNETGGSASIVDTTTTVFDGTDTTVAA